LQTCEKNKKSSLRWDEETSQGNSGYTGHVIIFTGQSCLHQDILVVSLKCLSEEIIRKIISYLYKVPTPLLERILIRAPKKITDTIFKHAQTFKCLTNVVMEGVLSLTEV